MLQSTIRPYRPPPNFLNYARIQDIHLRSNFVERWLGLARVLVQTASGNASAELTLEGLKQFEAVRDLPYSKMRAYRPPSLGRAAMSSPPRTKRWPRPGRCAKPRRSGPEFRASEPDGSTIVAAP